MARPAVLGILERIARQPTAPLHEHAVIEEAGDVAREAGLRVRLDSYGNIVLAASGRRRGPAIWLVAHMDHPGLEVIGPGSARLLGGVAPQYLRRGTRLRLYHDGERTSARLIRFTRSTRTLRFEGGTTVVDPIELAELSAMLGLVWGAMTWLFVVWQRRRNERHTNAR